MPAATTLANAAAIRQSLDTPTHWNGGTILNSRRYSIKCDDCKTEISRTDSLRASAAGGRCGLCSFDVMVALTRAMDTPMILEAFRQTDAKLDVDFIDTAERQAICDTRGILMEVLDERGDLGLLPTRDDAVTP
jgi:hypothetical protein